MTSEGHSRKEKVMIIAIFSLFDGGKKDSHIDQQHGEKE
jgi:hypothetical protein